MIILESSDFTPDDFVMVRPALVRKLGGNAVSALLLGRLMYRCGAQHADEDGNKWWRSSLTELAEEVGLSEDQTARAMRKLLAPQVPGQPETALILARQVNGHDRTKEYRVNVLTSQNAISRLPRREIADCTTRFRVLEDAKSRDVLSSKTAKTQPKREGTRARRAPSPRASLDALFETWYAAYPLKRSKGAAEKAYPQALQKAGDDHRVRAGEVTAAELLLAAAVSYAQDPNRNPGFTKYPATWLNQSCWLDEPLPTIAVNRSGNGLNELIDVDGMQVTRRSAQALARMKKLSLDRAGDPQPIEGPLNGGDHWELEGAPW